jgi:4-oxalocrotonate tautomerase
MPLVTIDVIKDVFSNEEKADMIKGVTEAMIAVEGEGMRDKTWVRITEVEQGDWGIGGQLLGASDINQATGRKHRLAA